VIQLSRNGSTVFQPGYTHSSHMTILRKAWRCWIRKLRNRYGANTLFISRLSHTFVANPKYTLGKCLSPAYTSISSSASRAWANADTDARKPARSGSQSISGHSQTNARASKSICTTKAALDNTLGPSAVKQFHFVGR